MVYLDNAATTRPSEAVIAAMTAAMQEGYFNPSSLYAPGYSIGKEIETFRLQLAKSLSAREVIFTSGGTEADNLAILGLLQNSRKKGRVLYSAVEHSAVAEPCQRLKDHYDVATLPVTASGIVDLDAAQDLMTPDTVLICVMQVNNEVGAIQPLEDLIRLRDELCPDAHLHVDGVQGFLHLDTKLSTGIDSYALSAHKFHGPKGVGALALGKRARINPLILGGKQENGLRAGTENTYGILGMQAAIQDHRAYDHDIRALKLRLVEGILTAISEAVINGPDPSSTEACDHIVNFSFPPVQAQTMMHALEAEGVLVSQGSACSSRKKQSSRTLVALGLAQARMDSALRFSLSRDTTKEDIDQAIDACARVYKNLRPFTRR